MPTHRFSSNSPVFFFRPLLNNRVLFNKNDLIIPQKMDTFIEESLWLTHRYKPIHKLTHYQNHTYILTYTHTPTLTHALTQTLTLTHTHAHTLTCTFSYTHSHTLSHTHTSTHTHILTCTLSYACTFSHSQILILTHTLTHHHIHTYTHIHTHSLSYTNKNVCYPPTYLQFIKEADEEDALELLSLNDHQVSSRKSLWDGFYFLSNTFTFSMTVPNWA